MRDVWGGDVVTFLPQPKIEAMKAGLKEVGLPQGELHAPVSAPLADTIFS